LIEGVKVYRNVRAGEHVQDSCSAHVPES
jgi:hypothetical protein